MTTTTTYLIVGASLAGAKAAEALRAEGFDGPLVMIGEETERPYERPPLSKDYLLGKAERETVYVHPQQWYTEHDVDLRLGVAVTAVHPSAHEVSLADGSRIGYAKLLLTTGSSPRRLSVPGADLDGVLYLRNLGDSDRIRAAFQSSSKVAVIGAGWIGLETAAAARAAGAEVTVLEMAELPLLRVLGRQVAQVFATLHRDHGVDLRCGVQVAEITGSNGRASGVLLADGSRIEADVVIAGVGITPNSQLASTAGLETSNGILVDAQLRSSGPGHLRRRRRSPARSIPCSASTSGSSTGPMRCTSRRPPPGRCSARTSPTTGCPTSSPTSTTWAWSTPATSSPTATTRSSSAATPPRASSSRSGCATGACWPA